LQKKFPYDVDLIKVDVPSDANPDTPWEMAKLGRQRYYEATAPIRKSWNEIGTVGYKLATLNETEPEDSDVYVVRTRRHVAVTPLSLDFTSRVDLKGIDKLLRE
jgi:broad specificity polyphosphatase/5'/3'-nucleotidase SurE